MSNITYYEELKNVESSEVRRRYESEEYDDVYKLVCGKILLERGDVTEEEFAKLTEKFNGVETQEQENAIPETLEECYKKDKISDNIWKLSTGFERAGKVFLVVLLLVGIILSILNSYVVHEVVVGSYWNQTTREVKQFETGLFFESLGTYILYAFIEYCAFEFVAKLLAGLASIVHSNKVTSKVALYMAKNR